MRAFVPTAREYCILHVSVHGTVVLIRGRRRSAQVNALYWFNFILVVTNGVGAAMCLAVGALFPSTAVANLVATLLLLIAILFCGCVCLPGVCVCVFVCVRACVCVCVLVRINRSVPRAGAGS